MPYMGNKNTQRRIKKTAGFFLTVFIVITHASTALVQNSYFDSIVSIEVNGGLGFTLGPMMSEERDNFEITVGYDDGEEMSSKPMHYGFRIGPRIDVTPLRKPNLKFGLRLGYDLSAVVQRVSVGDDYHETKSWSGRMMRHHVIFIGPLLIFGKTTGINRSVYGMLFLLNGPILGGDFDASPAAKDFGAIGNDIGNSSFNGWRFDLGVGFGTSISRFLIGLDLAYSPSIIKLDDKVYINVDKNTSTHEIILNMFMGFFI
ncbi:MAG: hypothetical protein GY847_25885 [Proteobacteria bacterium]|nr:hypothetical protein [Pseudomonadota bacterium]